MAIKNGYADDDFNFQRYVENYMNDYEKQSIRNEIRVKKLKEKEEKLTETKMAKKLKGLMSKVIGQMMRESSAVIDFKTGRVALQDEEGLVTVDVSGEKPVLVRDSMDMFSKSIPAFAIKVPLSEVKKGELYVSAQGKTTGFVLNVSETEIEVIDINGTISRVLQTKDALTQNSGVFIVRTPFAQMLGGETGQQNPMQQMFMLSSLMGEGEDGIDSTSMGKLFALSSMSSMFGGQQAGPLSLFGGGGQGGSLGGIMETLMMLEFIG